jgi:hypothetical protein
LTPELLHRWQSAAAPFDGFVVATCDEPDLMTIWEMLSFVCVGLQQCYPEIWCFSDWHEHDGFVVEPSLTTWQSFLTRIATPEALYESRDADDYVRIALFPNSFDWLLRYNIESLKGDYHAAWCNLDFSSTPNAPSAGLVQKFHAQWPGYSDVSAAKPFFDNSYGG